MYNDFMDELEYAADCGYDAICVNEHHSNGYGLMPSPNLIASALSRRTTDTAICVMGNSLALYNPPTRVAEEFAMIDCISGGRLIAGFPVGSPMDTCYAYGANPSMLRDRYYEAHDLIMKAWTEKETFAFNGRFNQQRYVNIWPRPIQQTPPIWIPGGGSVETWQWCAEDGLRLLLPVVLRLQGRAGDHGRVLDRDEASRQGPQPLPRRLPAVRRRRRDAASRRSSSMPSRPSTSTAAACTSAPSSPTRRAMSARRPSAPASRARSRAPPASRRRATRTSSSCWPRRWRTSSSAAT